MEDRPGFITPPPGLIPPARGTTASETSETVRLGDRRAAMPAFIPAVPGVTRSSVVESVEIPPAVVEPPPRSLETPLPSFETPPPVVERVETQPTVVERVETQPAVVEPVETRPPSSEAPPQWSLTLHDGSVRYISGTVLLGRDPARVEGWESAGLLVINDPERTISKTHAAIDCSGEEFFLVDLHSTNGVAIIAPDGTETIPFDGARTAVAVGATIELGRYRILLDRQ